MIRLTRQQVREVDRRAVEQFHMPGIVLMENAARGAADVAVQMLAGSGESEALILCGGGNNGGDGLAVARRLSNEGISVSICLCIDPAKYQGDALTNWRIAEAMNIPTAGFDAAAVGKAASGIIIDAVFGTGLSQPPRAGFEKIVEAVERSARAVLAIDLPSGLDCDSGMPLGDACMRAAKTVTFVAEKAGFANPQSDRYTGQVIVADIGCPRRIIQEVLQPRAGR